MIGDTLHVQRRLVIGDLGRSRASALLGVLAVAVSLATFSVFLGAERLVRGDLAAAHAATRPADVELVVDARPPAVAIDDLATAPGVAGVGLRDLYRVDVVAGPAAGSRLELVAVEDLREQTVGAVRSADSVSELGAGEILLDRSVLDALGVAVGEDIMVAREDGRRVWLRVAGASVEPGRAGWFEEDAFGVATMASAHAALGPGRPAIAVRLTDEARSSGARLAVEHRLVVGLEGHGVSVREVRRGGERAVADAVLEAAFVVLISLGLVTVFAGAMLVGVVTDLRLAAGARDRAILRALGAGPARTASLALAATAAIALPGVVIGLGAGAVGAWALGTWIAGLVNLDLASVLPPWPVVALEAAVGLGIPLTVATLVVRRAARGSARDALAESLAGSHRSALSRVVPASSVVGRMAVANAGRRPARLAFTVLTLGLSGSIALGTVGARAGLERSLEAAERHERWDVRVTLPADAGVTSEATRIVSVATGVAHVERWRLGGASIAFGGRLDDPFLAPPPGVPRPDRPVPPALRMPVPLIGVPVDSTVLDPALRSGTWLTGADPDAIVVNAVLLEQSGLALGDRITLRVAGEDHRWSIVGVAAQPLHAPAAFLPVDVVDRLTDGTARLHDGAGNPGAGEPGPGADAPPAADALVAVLGDGTSDVAVAAALSTSLSAAGIEAEVTSGTVRRRALEADATGFGILASLTLQTALLCALLGAIGLVVTMLSAAVERRRELAVMRALGAGDRTVRAGLTREALTMTTLAMLVAIVLAVPAAGLESTLLGEALLDQPIDPEIVPAALLGTALLAVVLAIVAASWPARQVLARPVRAAIVYE